MYEHGQQNCRQYEFYCKSTSLLFDIQHINSLFNQQGRFFISPVYNIDACLLLNSVWCNLIILDGVHFLLLILVQHILQFFIVL